MNGLAFAWAAIVGFRSLFGLEQGQLGWSETAEGRGGQMVFYPREPVQGRLAGAGYLARAGTERHAAVVH